MLLRIMRQRNLMSRDLEFPNLTQEFLLSGKLSTAYLLIKITCFVKKRKKQLILSS